MSRTIRATDARTRTTYDRKGNTRHINKRVAREMTRCGFIIPTDTSAEENE